VSGAGPEGDGSGQVGPSPAPGSGRPATRTSLGRIGVIVIIVVGILYLAGFAALSVFGTDGEVKVRQDHPGRENRDEPTGPGRLTLAPPRDVDRAAGIL